jgi:hypothetical protein
LASPCAVRSARCPDGLAIRRGALCAARRFDAGEPVFALKQVTWLTQAEAGAVAYARGRYVFDPVLALAAHAPEPNCRIALDLMVMIARRDIAEGEPITFSGEAGPHGGVG